VSHFTGTLDSNNLHTVVVRAPAMTRADLPAKESDATYEFLERLMESEFSWGDIILDLSQGRHQERLAEQVRDAQDDVELELYPPLEEG
jgi:hypothetical protein